ncbi:NADH-FMN oxidoreductase RutF, flavin reductase (DIM6/NTAB) family [Mesorhizobium albiziae]|uniref:NADH-FMN oxidoreductase RutF, flavin reductase (DIM6/NTAB) family n=1 Tax=Neomesorhizobium albiziae TaxID=335020 RepID=A0A1I3VP04_9HYPH|nr:flavin reductase family protein [Mesorhizobium albiziae]GLS29089.1 flavin reductase [Mesorhizobium albiziae]SFJ97108.1 NADH-FMN oxidoreductase RutF, flavin reductase (DIM6/NTAB) family [Mesorhizobium albiziae]
MEFDFRQMEADGRYRLLTNFVGPRPIALVTTRSATGRGNAAPMSFFNVFSHEPPIVVLGIQPRLSGEDKDTMVNIRRTGEFAVNMVDMALSQQMLVCGLAFESDVDELEMADLPTARCTQIDVDYVASSPCAFECRVERMIEYPRRVLVLGEVVHMHVHRDCLDAAGRYVNPDVYQPIARLHADNYITSDRQFVLKAPAMTDVLKASKQVD